MNKARVPSSSCFFLFCLSLALSLSHSTFFLLQKSNNSGSQAESERERVSIHFIALRPTPSLPIQLPCPWAVKKIGFSGVHNTQGSFLLSLCGCAQNASDKNRFGGFFVSVGRICNQREAVNYIYYILVAQVICRRHHFFKKGVCFNFPPPHQHDISTGI